MNTTLLSFARVESTSFAKAFDWLFLSCADALLPSMGGVAEDDFQFYLETFYTYIKAGENPFLIKLLKCL